MRRSDHSIRPPTPAATVAFASPNACTLCHADRPAAWADQQVRAWHERDYQAPVLQRAGWIARARKGDWSGLGEITAYLCGSGREAIWAASLLRLLRGCPDEAKWPAIISCLEDPSPLVRAAAVEALGDRMTPDTAGLLATGAQDDHRVVRWQAAVALAGRPLEGLPEAGRSAVRQAQDEFVASMKVRPDDFASHFNLGNYHGSRGEHALAVDEYTIAIRLQPRALPSFVNRALAEAALGQPDRAESSLRQALALDPASADANLNLGMLLAEKGRMAEAEQAFRAAFKSNPRAAPAAYNLGILLAETHPDEALEWCRRAVALWPQDVRYAYTLGYYLSARQRPGEAIEVLEAALRLQPDFPDVYHLLGSLYVRMGRRDDAVRVFQAAAANPALTPAARLRFGGARE